MNPAHARPPGRLAVVGAGWAGLAAAVEAVDAGWAVTLFDMAGQPGGRARSTAQDGLELDNGQHILIGAYRDTLALMRHVGVAPETVLHRQPLALVPPAGGGLRLPAGPALPAFLRGVLGWRELSWRARLALLGRAARWRLSGFRCPPHWSVERLCAGLPREAFEALIDPLCVAALNTPAHQASAQVLLTVLRDALFGPPGSADLLLPTRPLQQLLPTPALHWLHQQGARWCPGHRVHRLAPQEHGWQVDGEDYDAVVLACSAVEAGRLLADLAPDWSAQALAMDYQPIVTVWLSQPGARWPEAMMALPASPNAATAPAQFGFDLGQLGGPSGTFALVISGAARWVAQGREATVAAVRQQLSQAFADTPWPWNDATASLQAVRTEKRATFACTPGLQRPAPTPLPRLAVAGDHVAGPYPATLEGAVRSGIAAVRHLSSQEGR
ncbi:hydroxysqualene dehydroxylase HpnE [Ideonella sp. B7]|uniref:hydroxysqualene dehydroxylase HpnE n=1 Tax=Ideonella benzenivorans TaxID=2831643 RepID=UPI001CEC99DC|nr:hydroxysqualene dehydroxylase HpnE [Ideonella benzenivorans]MCA6217603.1 hydroxysqualene dehydroxylase HpnE [Ideonella benzenivorans]